jgi:putative oxidoreductase
MHAMTSRYTGIAYALMRFMLGALFLCHGVQVLFGGFGQPAAGTPVTLAGGVIELVAGLLIAVGLMTRPAAFLASGTMAVAYFRYHAPGGFWPLANGGELAVLYCFAFLFLSAYGGGLYSLDAAIRRGTEGAADPRVRRHAAAATPRG